MCQHQAEWLVLTRDYGESFLSKISGFWIIAHGLPLSRMSLPLRDVLAVADCDGLSLIVHCQRNEWRAWHRHKNG